MHQGGGGVGDAAVQGLLQEVGGGEAFVFEPGFECDVIHRRRPVVQAIRKLRRLTEQAFAQEGLVAFHYRLGDRRFGVHAQRVDGSGQGARLLARGTDGGVHGAAEQGRGKVADDVVDGHHGQLFAGQHLAFVVEDLEYHGGGAVGLFWGEG